MSHSREQGFMRFMQDFRDATRQHFAHLIGSTEQVSDNLETLRTYEQCQRDEGVVNPLVFVLQAEEQMAVMDLKSARNMFRLWNVGPEKERYRVQVSELIQKIRAVRWERAQLGGTQ